MFYFLIILQILSTVVLLQNKLFICFSKMDFMKSNSEKVNAKKT